MVTVRSLRQAHFIKMASSTSCVYLRSLETVSAFAVSSSVWCDSKCILLLTNAPSLLAVKGGYFFPRGVNFYLFKLTGGLV